MYSKWYFKDKKRWETLEENFSKASYWQIYQNPFLKDFFYNTSYKLKY